MAEETSTAGEPQQNADATGAGDPLTQLVADAKEKYGDAPSEGEPDSTEPNAEADKTDQLEGVTQKSDDKGAGRRMEQMLAAQRKALIRMGLDPDSEDLEKFNAGLIDLEDIKKGVRQQPQESAVTLDSFENFWNNIEQKRKQNVPITEDDFVNGMKFVRGVFKEAQQIKQSQESDKMNRLLFDCLGAVRSVIKNDKVHAALPEDIQNIEERFFIAATDSMWAEATGGGERNFTPDTYNDYARQNLGGDFNKLRRAWIDYGRTLASKPKSPVNVNPISSVEGGPPMSPPQKLIKMEDYEEAIRNYGRSPQPII